MKRYLAIIALILLSSSVGKTITSEKKQGLLVEAQFKYQNQNVSMSTKNTQILDLSMAELWTPITTPKEGITLFGRFTQDSKEIITWEFKVDDPSKDSNFSKSIFKVVARE